VILGPGNNTIDVQNYQMTLSGNITDSNPVSILGSSAGLLILSGNNTYSGSTTLTNGVSLQAGSTSALSPNSSFILAGTSTLDLHGFNNTVMQLSSTTTSTLVTNSGTNNATLTVSSGGAYYGLITDGFTNKTALSLTGSLLTLFSPNTYSGVTTISGSGELRALAQNAFSPNSLVNLTSANAILNLNGFNNTIAGLQGTTGTVNLGSNSTLTINGGLTTTFSGQIINAPCGSLVIDGNTNLTLNGTNNLYCGSTNIIKGTLNILAGGALSPNSNIQVQPLGNLSVNGAFTNNVPSLTTSGSVVNTGQSTLFLNTLTISNGTFVNNLGSIFSLQTTISGGTVSNINGGSIAGNAPGSSLSITGGVVSNGSICTAATGSIGDLTTSISFTGGVLNTNYHVIGSSYTQGPNATLNLTMCTVPSKFGQILADGVISLNGTLIVTAPPSFTPSPESFFPLVFKPAATSGIPTFSGQFSSIQLQGFSATPPARVITAVPHIGTGAPENIVTLYFAACVSSWNSAQSGLWSDNTKWLPPCVPGITLPPEVPIATNDEAIFPNVGSSAVTITLSYTNPLTPPQSVPISPVLLIMDFTANTTSYTINPFPAGGSQLIFDATPSFPSDAQILVEAGSHTINAPILLNIPTDLLLTDRAQLTFGSTVTMQSGTSVGGFFVAQGLSSTLGTGRLINQGTLSPAFFTFESATIQNNQGSFITPTGNFSMNPISGHTAHLINSGTLNPAANLLLQGSGTALIDNSGTGAIIGSSQPNSTFLLDGSGSIVIQNSGTGATFGGSGNSGLFLVSSSGPVTLNNTGAIATLGPTGAGSQFVVNGTGPIFLNNTGESASLVASGSGATFLLASPSATVLNQGLNVLMGAPGPDGNVIIQAGVIQNLLGAIFQAGDGGQLTMTGGTLTNDFTSTVGSLNQNILFSGGSLVNSGAIYAFDYTQEAPANLTLTLISASTHGFVHASGMLNLAGTLNVEALPGLSISNSDVIVLLEGDRDRIGTFSTVNLSGFPSNLIPSVYYSPTAVELLFSSSVTPSGNGTVTTFALSSITAFNILIGRENTLLHEWMYDRCYDPCYDHCKEKPFHKGKNDPCAQNDQLLFTARETPRKTQQLHDESESRRDRPWRIYMGPIGSVGSLDTIESQPGCDYTSFGLFAGIDHAGSNLGLGLALDYENMTGDLHKGAGHLHVHQIRVNGYANLMLKNLPELSLMAIGGGGYDWYSLGRTAGPTTAPITARSSPRGTEYDIFFGLEYIFAHKKFHMIPKGLRIVPMANIQYIGVSIDKFREKKGGTFSLRVDNQFRDSLRSYLGTRLDYTVGSSCCQLQTEFDLGWQREYLDHDFTLDASTASIMPTRRVEIPVFGLGRDTFLGGIDLLLTIYEAFQVEASYDLQWNSRLINNSVYLGIGGRF
jgi:autotransporter-associated beta strand protein